MNLTFDVAAALSALNRVLSAADKRGIVPIFAHVMLAVDELGNASVRTANGDMDASAMFPAQGAGEPIAIPAHTFADILRNLPAGADAKLTWEAPDARAKLQCGRSRFQLAFLPTDAWPIVHPKPWEAEVLVDPAAMMRAFKTVSWAACTDSVRDAIVGVMFRIEKHTLTMVATDAKVMARYRMDIDGPDTTVVTTVPNKMATEMQRMLTEARGEVWLSVRAGRVSLRDDRGELAGKVIDMPFPDVERLMDQEKPAHIAVGREALISTARRVVSATGGGDVGIKMQVSHDSLVVSARGENGEGADDLSARGGEVEHPLGITDHYLLEALSNTEGELVTIGYDGDNPFSVLGSDDRALILMATRRV